MRRGVSISWGRIKTDGLALFSREYPVLESINDRASGLILELPTSLVSSRQG